MMQDYVAVFCVFISSFLGAFGSFFFKKASGELKFSLFTLIANHALILGFALFGISSLVYLFGLHLSQLTIVYPISSLSYVWSLFIGKHLLQEGFSKLKIVGIVFIFIGNILVVTSI